jgi:hypothetical protein
MTGSFLSALMPYLPVYRATSRVTPAIEVDAERMDDRRRRAAATLKRQSELGRGTSKHRVSVLV